MIKCIQNLVKFCPSILKKLSKNQFLTSIKALLNNCEKRRFTIPIKILSMTMCIQNLVKFCSSILKILSKNQFLISIKGCNSIANLKKMTLYNSNIDLVNDKVRVATLKRKQKFPDISLTQFQNFPDRQQRETWVCSLKLKSNTRHFPCTPIRTWSIKEFNQANLHTLQ